MKIIRQDCPVVLQELTDMAEKMFGDLVKAVVDVQNGIMVVDAEMHADQEALLLEEGSRQQDLWGINLYPGIEGEDWVEFDSMINLRPSQGNLTRGVADPDLRNQITAIVDSLVSR